MPFAFAYTVFNPRGGQLAARNFRVRAFNAALGQPSSGNRTLSPLQFKNLSFADITGCTTIPDESSVLNLLALLLFLIYCCFTRAQILTGKAVVRAEFAASFRARMLTYADVC